MSNWKKLFRFLPLAFLAFLLAGCGEQNLTALDPKGPQSQWIYDKMLLSLYVMIFVAVVVFVIYVIVLLRFRRKPGDDTYPKQVHGSTALEITWTTIPVLLLIILAVPSIAGSFMLADTEVDPEDEDAVVIKVTGHQYWWQFDYEKEGFTASQEIYIPVGEKVVLELHAGDVQHAFWVPALAGKVDNIPGITNKMWIQADYPGVYYGKCAELCGPEHALMEFKLIALERDEYDAWIEGMKAATGEPDSAYARGYEVFQENGCIGCHAVSGMGSAMGPTLTNFGDRHTVAGYMEFNAENIEAWIRNSYDYKQGNKMGEFPDISEEDMDALVEYLMSLKVRE